MVKAITKETAIKEPSPRGPSKNKKIPGNSLKMAHKHIKKQAFNKLGLWAALARLDAATIIKTHAAIFKKPPPNVGIQPSNFQPSNESKTKETMVMIQPSNVPKTKETMAMILPRWMWFEVFINQNHSKVCKFGIFLKWKHSDFFYFFKKQNFPRSTLIFFENFLKKSLKIKKNQQFFLYQKGKLA